MKSYLGPYTFKLWKAFWNLAIRPWIQEGTKMRKVFSCIVKGIVKETGWRENHFEQAWHYFFNILDLKNCPRPKNDIIRWTHASALVNIFDREPVDIIQQECSVRFTLSFHVHCAKMQWVNTKFDEVAWQIFSWLMFLVHPKIFDASE